MPQQSTIPLRCPRCDKSLSVAIEYAGKRGKCPTCGTVFQIPSIKPQEPLVPITSPLVSHREEIGVTEPACPYCCGELDKSPGRKKKCPACGNDIFVRTRPQDKARILVRKDQLLAVEEQWAIANGTHDQFLAIQQRRQNVIAQLRSRFGSEPSENDIDWALLNDDILTSAQQWDWGLYRNARFAMAEILSKEKKLSQALDFLLEVCYVDINGPRNCGGMKDPELLRQFPPFDPTIGDLAPGIVGRIQDIMQLLKESSTGIERRFMAIANRLVQRLKLPLNPDQAWLKLEGELSAK